MFEGLRKKIGAFTEKLKQTIEKTESVSEKKDSNETSLPPAFDATKKTHSEALSRPTDSALSNDAARKQKPEPKRALKTNIDITKKAQAIFTGTIELTEKDLSALLEELELSLLEADVEQETAFELVQRIRKTLVGKKIGRTENIDSAIQQFIRNELLELMNAPAIDLLEKTQTKKPLVILLLGPNGAGKTTTLAKLTYFFQQHNKKCVWSASDTFRAASIEQLEKHAQKLQVRIVKHTYGADPAAVAFDAIQSARAHSLDVVLIDSAGRQETNKNLMEELKKMVRVAKPDLTIFVAESYAGQALLQQAQEFDSALGLDGFILTKMDADPKGGTLLSLLFKLKKPVLFLGTGQEYSDLEAFDAQKTVEKIIPL